MSENTRKMLSFLIAMAMLFTLTPMYAGAQGQIGSEQPAVEEAQPAALCVPEEAPEETLSTSEEVSGKGGATLQSITFTPVSVVENTNGYFTSGWNEETQTDLEYYFYNVWALLDRSTYTATFTDGTVLNGSAGFEYDGQWYPFEYSSNQSDANPWTVGNTYYIDVAVMGQTAQVPVTITESPLQSITFTPISMVEKNNGYFTSGWNEETQTNLEYYFYYEWDILHNRSTYTATFTDGTVLNGSGSGFEYNGQWYDFSSSSNQSATNPWTAGNTYYIDVAVMGLTTQVPVTIIESPLQSITFTPVSVMEESGGYFTSSWDEENQTDLVYYYYSEWGVLYRSTYTATFTDGTVLSGCDSGFEYDGQWYSFEYRSNQSSTNPWMVGNTYYIDVIVMGQTAQVPVTITEFPLQSITFTPVSTMENAGGYFTSGWDEETQTDLEYYRYSEWDILSRSTFTATLTDGTVLSGSGSGFEYDGQWYSFDYSSNQSASNIWTAGNTYYIDITIMGQTAQVPVTITECPLQSITFTPVSVMEGTAGYFTSGWDEETQVEVEYYHYSEWGVLYRSTYTATFTDGTVLSGSDSGFEYDGQWYDFNTSSNQNATNPWTAGNAYSIGIVVMGQTARIPVTITGSPVQSITFTPVSVMENTEGYITNNWEEDNQTYLEYYHYSEGSLMYMSTFTVTFTDGTVLSDSNSCFEYDGQWYPFNYSSNQSASNIWTAGNTYYIDITVMGQTARIPVTITESPLQSIIFTPVSLVENTTGYFSVGWDEESQTDVEYYRYSEWNLLYRSTYTATFADGTVISGSDSSFTYNGQRYDFSINSNQSASNIWTAGNTYYIDVDVMSRTARIPVIVTETPVASVTFDPIAVEEYGRGDWYGDEGAEYFVYDWEYSMTYTVTFKDGTVLPGSHDSPVVYDGEFYTMSNYADDQSSETPWLAGNTYCAQVAVAGKRYDVFVSVQRSTEDNGYCYIIHEDQAIIMDCTTTGEILDIPATIQGYPVTGITSLGEAINYALEIRIPDSVTMLSEDVFRYNWDSVLPLEKLVLGKGISDISASMLDQAQSLEQVEVSGENPWFCSIDGVVYDKEVTTLVIYPPMKQGSYTTPDSVTNLDINLNDPIYANFDIHFGAGIEGYREVDGIIYNEDMTAVVRCTSQATGSYIMPETVTDIYLRAFQYTNLTSVTISPKVTEIVYGAFMFSQKLQEITLPESVNWIDTLAFVGCESLEKIHIPSVDFWCQLNNSGSLLAFGHNLYIDGQLVRDLVIPETVTILESDAFKGGSFETVSIPASVERIEYDAFMDCTNLKKVYITDLAAWSTMEFGNIEANPLYYAKDLYMDGQLVTDMVIPQGVQRISKYAFYNGSMKNVTVPSSVQSIGYKAFYAAGLETITLAEGLWRIEISTFEKSALKSVVLPDSLEYLGERAFYECTALESVDLGGGLTYIDEYTFYNTGLKSLMVPKQITTIYRYAFACSDLTQVQFDCDEVELYPAVFMDCPLGDLELGDNITYLGHDVFLGTEATQVILPPSVTNITYRAFAFSGNLVSVTIPDTVEYIDPQAFEQDVNLSHVLYTGTQDQWNALNVESYELNQATLHCEAVGDEVTTEQNCTHVRFFCTICDRWETVKKKNASHSFQGDVCTVCGQQGFWEYIIDEVRGTVMVVGYVGNEAHVVIPDELDGLPVTAFTSNTFAYSRRLQSVTIPGTVAEISGGSFRDCEYLEKVTIESGVTSIGTSAFTKCYNLEQVILPDTVTAIGDHAFSECRRLKQVVLPDAITQIGNSTFSRCYALGQVELPENLTSIGDYAFYSTSLRELQIPEGVTEIGAYAFTYCDLEEVRLPETLITIGECAFDNHYLTSLEIPASVQTIGEYALRPDSYYDNLHTLTFRGAAPAMEDVLGKLDEKLTVFYDPTLPGWEEYIAGDQENIVWYSCDAPQIRLQPQSVTVESGSTATVCTEGYGHRLSYQWYCAAYGSEEFTAIGGNSIELSLVMDGSNPTVRAYCVISDVLGRTAVTETVTLKINAEPVGIRINRLPDLVEYDLYQELRTEGLEVVMVYADATEAVIEGYRISGYQPDVAGEQSVIVSYGSHTASFQVTVNADRLHFTDQQEGVEISASKEALSADTVLSVEQVELPETPELFRDKKTLSFDITLLRDGQPVQPQAAVKVSIPVPAHMNGKQCGVYHVDEQGNLEDMHAVPAGEYLEFYTDHFSLYSVVELPGYTLSGNIAAPDGAQTVTVTLLKDGQQVQSQQTTTGSYQFDDVVDGSYTLEVRADGGKVRSYAITVAGAQVYQNLSLVEYAVTFLDWDGSVISTERHFEGSLVTAPADPVRESDHTYFYTFTGWDKEILPCTQDAVYTATYSYSYLNQGGTIAVGSTVAGVGQQFALPVSVSGNVGIAGLKHKLSFDAMALKFIGVEFQGDFAQGTSVINDSKAQEGQLSVLWFGDQDVETDGTIYNLVFEVLTTATDGQSDVTIDFSMDGNANSIGQNVIFDAVDGVVQTRTYCLGDLSGDYKYAMVDLVMLAQYVAEFDMELTQTQLLSADVNEDGNIDLHDVLLLNQWLLDQKF